MVVVLIPKGNSSDYRGIGLLGPIWKVIDKVTSRSSERYLNSERAIKGRFIVFLSRIVTTLLKFSPAYSLQNRGWTAKNDKVGLEIYLPFPCQVQ